MILKNYILKFDEKYIWIDTRNCNRDKVLHLIYYFAYDWLFEIPSAFE